MLKVPGNSETRKYGQLIDPRKAHPVEIKDIAPIINIAYAEVEVDLRAIAHSIGIPQRCI